MAGRKANSLDGKRSVSGRVKTGPGRFDVVSGRGLGPAPIDPREEQRFRSLDVDHSQSVPRRDLEQAPAEAGLGGICPVTGVRYCVVQKVDLNPQDCWGNTPLDDAIRHERGAVAELLQTEGGQVGRELSSDHASQEAA